jgi:hypothetical protein
MSLSLAAINIEHAIWASFWGYVAKMQPIPQAAGRDARKSAEKERGELPTNFCPTNFLTYVTLQC